MNEITYHRVHVGYITANGEVKKPGVYSSTDIDVAEASARSYVTLELNYTHEPDITSSSTISDVKVLSSGAKRDNDDDIKDIVLEPTVTSVKPKEIRINYLTLQQIIDLKYVGKKTADRVILARKDKPFTSYEDMDTRVSLPLNRQWNAVGYITFDAVTSQVDASAPSYQITETASPSRNVSK